MPTPPNKLLSDTVPSNNLQLTSKYLSYFDLSKKESIADTIHPSVGLSIADPTMESANNSKSEHFFSYVKATPVKNPNLLLWSHELAAEIFGDLAAELDNRTSHPENNIHPDGIQTSNKTCEISKVWAQYLSGNQTFSGSKPFATRYGGFQFGHWAGQLGDGRALNLGEHNGWEIQLKGAGPTPYSRSGDGRAVLRSSIREYLCSEYMHYLGIPTTRALALVTTGEDVIRDMFYDGHPVAEPGAIVTRVAPSFLRFGHYEILAASGQQDSLKKIIQFTIKNYFPSLLSMQHQQLQEQQQKQQSSSNTSNPNQLISESPIRLTDELIVQWFTEIATRTADLIAQWMRVGFVHGVLNTDNMSILGLTIDFGPYGWLDAFDPAWTPNTTDRRGRYSYAQQPQIAFWNLHRLAEAIGTIMQDPQSLATGLQVYQQQFNQSYVTMMFKKMGLSPTPVLSNLQSSLSPSLQDLEWIEKLVQTISPSEIATNNSDDLLNEDGSGHESWKIEIDMTLFFSHLPLFHAKNPENLLKKINLELGVDEANLTLADVEGLLRTLLDASIKASSAVGEDKDLPKENRMDSRGLLHNIFLGISYCYVLNKNQVPNQNSNLDNPSNSTVTNERVLPLIQQKILPWLLEYFHRSRNSDQRSWDEIYQEMKTQNPQFLLRNYLVQEAISEIESAKKSALSNSENLPANIDIQFIQKEKNLLHQLLLLIRSPYEANSDPAITEKFFAKRPEWARNKPGSSQLSCSS